MAMTSGNMAPKVEPNPVLKIALTAEQVKAAMAQAQARTVSEEESILKGAETELNDQIAKETQVAQEYYAADPKLRPVALKDLTEDDAYDFSVPIAASADYSPNFLKIILKDSNYVARWGNTNSIRQGQLVAQGFKYVTKDDVANFDTLEMHLNEQDKFVWADLIAVKIPKAIYYAGLRRAYIKSLHATNSKKATEAGAAYAKNNHTSQLSASERSYMQQHEQNNKPIYNPNIGA